VIVRGARAACTCALFVGLAACGGSETPSFERAARERQAQVDSAERAASGSTDSAQPVSAAADTTAFRMGTVSAPSTVQENVALLSGLRTGVHETFERVILELAGGGSGFPSYHVEYIDRPLFECGSGRQVQPIGDAWLEIRMEPLNAHTEEGQPTIPRAPRDFPELANIRRLYVTCDFEAVTTLVLAVASPNRFRVLTLEEPRRIVVDVSK
jgi:hypothetical protein